jgi:hypothetical protein
VVWFRELERMVARRLEFAGLVRAGRSDGMGGVPVSSSRRGSEPSPNGLQCLWGDVQDPYFRCPHCGHALKSHCPACSRVVETIWKFCPYCNETVTGRMAANPQPQEGDVP